jgi:hypothetical protein
MFSDDFGYTLVGAKPASLDESTYRLKRSTALYNHFVDSLKSIFDNSSDFIFRDIGRSLWLINVREMTRMVNKHSLFKTFIVKKFGTIDKFFSHLRYGSQDLFEIFERKNDIIAIALGYGLDNGRYFERRKVVGRYLRKYPIRGMYPFEILPCVYYVAPLNRNCFWLIDEPTKFSQFASLEEEWLCIKQNKWDLRDETIADPPYYFKLPTYVSCKSEEAKEVHKRFVRARNRLAKLLSSYTPSEAISHIVQKGKNRAIIAEKIACGYASSQT